MNCQIRAVRSLHFCADVAFKLTVTSVVFKQGAQLYFPELEQHAVIISSLSPAHTAEVNRFGHVLLEVF